MSYSTKFIGQIVKVSIDRPLGSNHPKYDLVYPINYGCIKGVMAPDGEELDAYILGISEPRDSFEGKCIAAVHRLDDDDDKLIVVPKDDEMEYTDEKIFESINFQEKYFKSIIIRK
ncbi:inorganic pyrophosphatase [Candidatus Parcubacteria bacterium]|jgi:inorganic pyrophosphatase|nr:inorganic pyrophosphatase [Candidatus Parcubacteria bacterium]MBT7228830.1 inorganic pyrophosphatase [Candidatus Parcubacteria bacterium]